MTQVRRRQEWRPHPRRHARPRPHTRAAARWLALVPGLLVAAAGPAPAGFDDGMAAAKRGDYRGAFEIWLPLAQEGDIRAHLRLDLAVSGTEARKFRRRSIRKRDNGAERLTPEQVTEAQGLARDWRPK